MAVGRSISGYGDPRAVWGSFSRLDQSPTPCARPYPSSNRKRGKEKRREEKGRGGEKKKNDRRLGLPRDEDASMQHSLREEAKAPPFRWPIEIRLARKDGKIITFFFSFHRITGPLKSKNTRGEDF